MSFSAFEKKMTIVMIIIRNYYNLTQKAQKSRKRHLNVRSARAYTSVMMIVRIFYINLEGEEEKKKGEK